MRESPVCFVSEPGLQLAGALCLPEDATPSSRVPAVVLLGGTGGDTRDGDMAPERTSYIKNPARRGLQRRIAHQLAQYGIGSLRFDKRGCGESGGLAEESDYDTDLTDNLAGVRWLRDQPAIDAERVGVIGHSAGAFNACMVARELPDIACAGLLGALHSSIEDLMIWNWGRVRHAWAAFTDEQRAWLKENRPREVVGAFRIDAYLQAARGTARSVQLEAEGVALDVELVRFRQDMQRPVAHEFQHVRCPALVLHGGEDMNVRVEDALDTYRALRAAGNEQVELVIVPGVDHSFQPVVDDAVARVWDRVSLATMGRPVSPIALQAISSWAKRVLHASVPPDAETPHGKRTTLVT